MILKPRFKYFFLILFLCSYPFLFSQTLLIHNYLKEDGLPDLLVYDLCQDTEGNMWFATKSGITKYDGTEWSYFDNRYSLHNKEYNFLAYDVKGNIWTISENPALSVEQFVENRWNTVYQADSSGIIPGSIQSFLIWNLENQSIPVLTSSNGGLYLIKDEQIISIPVFRNRRINSVKIFSNKCVIVTDTTIYVSEDGKIFSELYPDRIRNLSTRLKDICIESYDERSFIVWILGENEIIKINNDKKEINKLNLSIMSTIPERIFVDDYFDHIVLGNSKIVYLWDKKFRKLKKIGKENGLSTDGANNVFLDIEKNLWFASLKGASKISSMRFSNYSLSNGLLNNRVTSILELKTNSFILGHPDGVTLLDNENALQIQFESNGNIFQKNIGRTSVFKSADQIIIASSKKGFGELVNKTHVGWYPSSYYKNETPVAVISNSQGQIFAATTNSIFRITNNSFINIRLPDKYSRININNIAIGLNDELMIATDGDGIVYMNQDGTWGQYLSEELYSNNVVHTITFIEKLLLAGTSGGLATIENGKLNSFNISELNITESVHSILMDKNSSVWIGTSSGVYKWDRNDVQYFGQRQGLAGIEVEQDAIIEDGKGNIWIGTDDGLSKYNPEFDYNSKLGPILTIENIEAGGKSLPIFENSTISYDDNNFLFKINVGSFIDEKLNRYSVKLEGFDKQWLENLSGNQKYIRYTNLPSGKYRLLVRAKDAMGNWSSPLSTGVIMIKVPFYKETWFFVPVIILIGIIIFNLVIYFERARYTNKLESEVIKRTKEVEESQKRYQVMFEYNKAVLLVIDAETFEIVDANPAAKEFYGKQINEAKRFHLKLLEAEVNVDNDYIKIFDEMKNSFYHTTKHKVNKGQIKEVELYFSRFSSEEGNLFFVIVHDITETRRSQEQIKKLTAAVEQSSQIIFITNTEGLIEYVNPKFCEITGFTKEEAIGKNPNILKSGKRSQKEYKELWDTISAGSNYRGEFLNKKKNGEMIWVSTLITPVRTSGNAISHYLAVEEDITEKRFAQQELIKSESKVKAILNAIPDLMLQISSEGKIVGCHYSENALLVVSPEESLGEKINDVLPKDFVKTLFKKMKSTLKSEEFEKFDYEYIHKGDEIYFECRLIKNDENTVLVILRDITQRKLFEKDIILAKEEAEKSDRLKTEFLAHMSHEIRTPVNSIVNFSELIKENLKDKLDPRIFEKLSFIETNSKRLINTIDAIIDIAKIQSGSYQADFEYFNIVSCLSSVVKEMEQTAVDKNIVLSYTSKIDNKTIFADNLSVREIFYHLIDNAIKFTQIGTVKILIDSLKEKEIKVEISDTGIGISKTFLPDIFKAFSQEQTGYSRNYEGNGLGLALVKSYCDLNNVFIECESEKGKGSKFTLILKSKSMVVIT